MKQILKIFMLLAIVATFTACEKDEPQPATPDRDKFIGTWTGTGTMLWSFMGETETTLESMNVQFTKSGEDNEVELILDEKATAAKAVVNGSRIDIKPNQKIFLSDGETMEEYVITGFASINSSGLLSMSFQMTMTVEGLIAKIVFTGDLSKKP